MNDRELLELAAKAAGINGHFIEEVDCFHFYLDKPDLFGTTWAPLTDDGDALRLAVKLNIIVFQHRGHSHALDDDEEIEIIEPHNDRYAATRRAIVRAAAEIGRNMQ